MKTIKETLRRFLALAHLVLETATGLMALLLAFTLCTWLVTLLATRIIKLM
jgi:hypothetical protein